VPAPFVRTIPDKNNKQESAMTDKTSLAAGTFAGARARIQDNASRGLWSSRWVFFLAATGSAVGLGNIWKFPYVPRLHPADRHSAADDRGDDRPPRSGES